MKRLEAALKIKELIYYFDNFSKVETKEEDVESLKIALECISKDIKEEYTLCNCCRENSYVLIVDNIKLCKTCLERLKEISL